MVKYNTDGTLNAYPGTYGGNLGPWMVYDPTGKQKSLGSFFVNSHLKPANFTDGLSKTLLAAEIKAWSPYFSGSTTATSTFPASPAAICALGGTAKVGPNATDNKGHTEWGDGKAQQTGMTSLFPPNTAVTCTSGGMAFDIDFVTASERLVDHRGYLRRHDLAQLPPRGRQRRLDGRLGAAIRRWQPIRLSGRPFRPAPATSPVNLDSN